MKTCKFTARFAVLPLAIAAAFPVFAQNTLPETVVTANRSAQLLTDALPHTTVLGRDVIDRSQAQDLPTLLASEAGFQFTQNGGKGTSSTLFLRGSASMQVLVLIDGVPLTKQDTTGAVSLEHIMLDQIERVEVVRGNVSAIYGSGAMGGVIQIFTRSGSGKPSAYVQTEVGSFGTARLLSGASGQWGDTHFAFGLGRHVSSGFSAMNTAQFPNENPDADGYRNTNYNLALSQELIKGHTVGLRSQGSDGQFDADGGGSNFVVAGDIYRGRNKLDSWSLYSHNQISSDWRSEVTYSEARERAIYDATLTSSPYSSDATTRSQTLNITQVLAVGAWLITAGAERQNQAIDATDNYATDLNRQRGINAVFAGISGNLGLNSLQVNMRHDVVEGMDSKSTGYVAYGYQITPAVKLIASLSTSFNLPPLGYLYDLNSGNPDLKPETARSKEVGVQWAQDKQVLRATYFDTRVINQLQYNFDTWRFDNISSASNQGLEVSYSGNLYGADMRASLTLQDPVNESTGEQLVRRARTMASLGASMPWGSWALGGDLRYTGARPDTSSNPDLAAYVVANLTARYALSPQIAITGRIENVLDQQYQTAYGYNQSGRAVYIGAVWSPK
jgi:vitamin B12 transporter